MCLPCTSTTLITFPLRHWEGHLFPKTYLLLQDSWGTSPLPASFKPLTSSVWRAIKVTVAEDENTAWDPGSRGPTPFPTGCLEISYHRNRSSSNDPSLLLGGSRCFVHREVGQDLSLLSKNSTGVILRIKSWQTFPDTS